MCLNPLKGFINEDGYIIKVANRRAEFVRLTQGKIVTFYDKNLMIDGDFENYIDIPCRSCPECYSNMRREWIARATAEMMLHDKALFVTFTYKDYNDGIIELPRTAEMITEDGEVLKHHTLYYRDFQLFMKRLRKHFSDRNIRYMVCGEYGSRTFRPHYHAIIYGIGIDDFPDMLVHNKNKSGDLLYSSITLDNLWSLGYTLSSSADNGTIAYVAGYVAKKFTALKSKEWYEVSNVVPPFIRSSNKPGLGRDWFEANRENYSSEYDYKVIPALSINSTPTSIYLTSTWRKSYVSGKLHESSLAEVLDYEKKSVARRVKLIDNHFSLLNTDKDKNDYNTSLKHNFRKRLERKRGVY